MKKIKFIDDLDGFKIRYGNKFIYLPEEISDNLDPVDIVRLMSNNIHFAKNEKSCEFCYSTEDTVTLNDTKICQNCLQDLEDFKDEFS